MATTKTLRGTAAAAAKSDTKAAAPRAAGTDAKTAAQRTAAPAASAAGAPETKPATRRTAASAQRAAAPAASAAGAPETKPATRRTAASAQRAAAGAETKASARQAAAGAETKASAQRSAASEQRTAAPAASAAGTPETKPAPRRLYPDEAGFQPDRPVAVGGLVAAAEPIAYNLGRRTVRLKIRNTGDRPIQVGSHFHLFEVNRYLAFDRDAAFGCHLNIPATTAVRFEPGDEKEVEAVAYAGKRRVIGFNGLVMGYTGDEDAPAYLPVRIRSLRTVRDAGFKVDDPEQPSEPAPALRRRGRKPKNS